MSEAGHIEDRLAALEQKVAGLEQRESCRASSGLDNADMRSRLAGYLADHYGSDKGVALLSVGECRWALENACGWSTLRALPPDCLDDRAFALVQEAAGESGWSVDEQYVEGRPVLVLCPPAAKTEAEGQAA